MMAQFCRAAAYISLTAIFLAIAVQDVRSRRIPNVLLLAAASIRVTQMVLVTWMDAAYLPSVIASLLIGAAVTVLAVLIWFISGKMGLIIGAGDLKYMMVLSFCLEADLWLYAMLACLGVLVICLTVSLCRKKASAHIPGGLYLSVGAVFACVIALIRIVL